MVDRLTDDEGKTTAAMKDIDALAPAIDQFLFEVCNAGKIPMSAEMAHRYRELKRWIEKSVNQARQAQAVDSRGFPMRFTWCAEIDEINRRHPPPRLSREIRNLMQARALRALLGPAVSPAQDAFERAQIAAASEWPCHRRDNQRLSQQESQRETGGESCNKSVSNESQWSTQSSAIAAAIERSGPVRTTSSRG